MDTTQRGHFRWKYKYVYDESRGRAWAEHRVILERQLGRRLTRSEHVHHKDGNTLNNNLDNLEIVSASEHTIRHSAEYKAKGKGWGCGRRVSEGLGWWTPARGHQKARVVA